jgi:hypothetical protein
MNFSRFHTLCGHEILWTCTWLPLIRSNPGSVCGSLFWPVLAQAPAVFPRPRFSDGIFFLQKAAQPCLATPQPRDTLPETTPRDISRDSPPWDSLRETTPRESPPRHPPRDPTLRQSSAPMSTVDPLLAETRLALTGGTHLCAPREKGWRSVSESEVPRGGEVFRSRGLTTAPIQWRDGMGLAMIIHKYV